MAHLIPPVHFPGMKPWLCEYDGPDGRYGITLHGSDPSQIVADNRSDLPGLVVLGEHCGTVPAGPAPGREDAG